MKIKYRETQLLFQLLLKIYQNTQFIDIKCLKIQNKCVLTFSINFSLIFISIQNDIMVCANTDELIFSNVVTYV